MCNWEVGQDSNRGRGRRWGAIAAGEGVKWKRKGRGDSHTLGIGLPALHVGLGDVARLWMLCLHCCLSSCQWPEIDGDLFCGRRRCERGKAKAFSDSRSSAGFLCHLRDDQRQGAVLFSQLLILLSQSTQGGHLVQVWATILIKIFKNHSLLQKS